MNPTETPQVTATPVAPAAPAAPAPAAPVSERERIAQKAEQYTQNLYQQPQAEAAPVAPVADPAVQPSSEAAVPPPLTTEQVLMSVVEKLQSLESRISAPQAPATPATPAPAAEPEPGDWLDLLAKGKRAEGEAALAAMIAKQITPKIAPQAADIENRVIEQVNAQREMHEFTAAVRQQNADIAEMEPYIGARVQTRLNEAVQNGSIKTPADYATVYKNAVTEEVKAARNLYLRIRGAGAASAQTRQSTVVASPTLQPTPINTQREAAPPAEPEIETPQAYLAKRMARSAQQRGLSVA